MFSMHTGRSSTTQVSRSSFGQTRGSSPLATVGASRPVDLMSEMKKTDLLLARLDAIGRSLSQRDDALALMGLGSVGMETNRLDEYSDLDFFVIVENGAKGRYIERLDWLSAVHPIAFQFQNTVDGHKVLYEDGIFCEFAIFEPLELAKIPFSQGRIVWRRDGVADSIATPIHAPDAPEKPSEAWLLGEALTNIYIGLGRFRRGEKLSAARFVQQFAVDKVLELADLHGETSEIGRDRFSPERRIEERNPELAALLPQFVQGYERTPESAVAILDYLSARHPVNDFLVSEIRRLTRG